MAEPVARRRVLGLAAASAAAVALGGGSAVARDLESDQARSELASTSGSRVAGRRAHHAQVVWSVPTGRPVVALTFDDGPDPALTPSLLDVLARHGARATFLMEGHHARRRPDLVRAVVDAGHEVGQHTWSHPDLARCSPARTTAELRDATAVLEDLTGRPIRWFRPPWGNLTGAALRVSAELGQDVLLWSAGADHLPRRLEAGDVLLFHDGVCRGGRVLPFGRSAAGLEARRRQQLARVPDLLREVAGAGLTAVTADELTGRPAPP